jgi:hypothetical protein
VGAQHGDLEESASELHVPSRVISQKAAVSVVYAGAMFIAVMDAAKSFAGIFVWGIATYGLTLTTDPRITSGVRYPVTA